MSKDGTWTAEAVTAAVNVVTKLALPMDGSIRAPIDSAYAKELGPTRAALELDRFPSLMIPYTIASRG